MTTPEVRLLVGGKRYGGWSSVRITRSVEAMSGSFALEVFDRWSEQQTSWPIHEDDECTVQIGDETLITGRVDVREVGFGAGALASVTGRDAARDLVDCACVLDQWEVKNVDVLSFVRKVCKPYGIPVALQTGLTSSAITVPKKLSIDPGDTAAGAIEAVCRVAGLLAISDGRGGLVLTRAGTARCTDSLLEGANVLSARARYDRTQRFRRVIVLGTKAGTDEESGTVVINTRGQAEDLNSPAQRVTIVRPESSVNAAQAKTRAQWEVAVRAARGDTYSATVQGWTQSNGALWPLNSLVHLRSPTLEVDEDLLVSGLTLTRSRDGGTTTSMDLRHAGAFAPMPQVPVRAGSGSYAELRGGV